MKYASEEIIEIETEIENDLFGYSGEQPRDTVQIKLLSTVTNTRKPYITYWEVLYLDETGMHKEKETRVLSERKIMKYKVLTGDVESEYVTA